METNLPVCICYDSLYIVNRNQNLPIDPIGRLSNYIRPCLVAVHFMSSLRSVISAGFPVILIPKWRKNWEMNKCLCTMAI